MSASNVGCTGSKSLHVAAAVVYNLGGSVIVGLARLIIATAGYIYYSCCSAEAKVKQKIAAAEEEGDTLNKMQGMVQQAFGQVTDQVRTTVRGGMTAVQAQNACRRQMWRGFTEFFVVGAWYHTVCYVQNPDAGLFGFDSLNGAVNRLSQDVDGDFGGDL